MSSYQLALQVLEMHNWHRITPLSGILNTNVDYISKISMNASQLIRVNTDKLSIWWNPIFDRDPTAAVPPSLKGEKRVEYEMEEDNLYFVDLFNWWLDEGRDVLHALAENFHFKPPSSNVIWNKQRNDVQLIHDYVAPGCARLPLHTRDPVRTRTDKDLSKLKYTISNLAGKTIVEEQTGLATMTGEDILKTHGLVGHLYADDQDVNSTKLGLLRSTHPYAEAINLTFVKRDQNVISTKLGLLRSTFVKRYPTLYLWPLRRVSIRGDPTRMLGFMVATLTKYPENDKKLKLGNLAYNPATGTLAADAGPFTIMLEGLTQIEESAETQIASQIAAQIGRDIKFQKEEREGRLWNRRRSRSRSRSQRRAP